MTDPPPFVATVHPGSHRVSVDSSEHHRHRLPRPLMLTVAETLDLIRDLRRQVLAAARPGDLPMVCARLCASAGSDDVAKAIVDAAREDSAALPVDQGMPREITQVIDLAQVADPPTGPVALPPSAYGGTLTVLLPHRAACRASAGTR